MGTLTYKEAEWLVNFSKNTLGLKLQGDVVNQYYEAERLLMGKDKINSNRLRSRPGGLEKQLTTHKKL